MRLVLDTNVVASAMLWGGNPLLLLQARREKRADPYTSTAMLAELTDILARPKFEKKIAASTLTVDQLVDRYAEFAQVVRPIAIPRTAPDPDDDVVIGTALAAKADLLVTGDRGLLDVGAYQGVRIVGVAEAARPGAEVAAAHGTHQPVAQAAATHGDGNAGSGARPGKSLRRRTDAKGE